MFEFVNEEEVALKAIKLPLETDDDMLPIDVTGTWTLCLICDWGEAGTE